MPSSWRSLRDAATADEGTQPLASRRALLQEIIETTGRSKSEIATRLGISRQQLYDILNEKKPVSPETAVRLGKLFGNGGGLWLRMQTAFDLWHAERETDTSKIETIEA
jgi:addiction module HigA family antidote